MADWVRFDDTNKRWEYSTNAGGAWNDLVERPRVERIDFDALTGAADYRLYRDTDGHVKIQLPDTKALVYAVGGQTLWYVQRADTASYVYLFSNPGANSEHVRLQKSDSGVAYLLTDKFNSGSHRDLHIGTQGAASLIFRTNATSRWYVSSTGILRPFANIAYDIGVPTARVRQLYMGDSKTPYPHQPGCHVYDSGAQVIGSATWTARTWNSEHEDTNAFHNPASNPTRITIPTDYQGKYLIYGYCNFAEVAGSFNVGRRIIRILKDGAVVWAQLEVNPGNASGARAGLAISFVAPIELVATNYLEMQVYQSSGVNVSLDTAGGFGITRLGDWS